MNTCHSWECSHQCGGRLQLLRKLETLKLVARVKALRGDKTEQSTLHSESTNIIAKHLTHLRARFAPLMYSMCKCEHLFQTTEPLASESTPTNHRSSCSNRLEPQPASQSASQSVRRLCKWKSGPRWRWESFYLVDTHYKGEFQTSEMEALRSIMVSALSARNEIYTFEEHFTRGIG